MFSRTLVTLIALSFSLLAATDARAQARPADRKEKQQAEIASVEKLIANLQSEIDQLKKELQIARPDRNKPAVGFQPVGFQAGGNPPGGKTTVKIFTVKYAKAPTIAKALHDLFPEKDGVTLRIACEPNLNILMVRGNAEELDLAEAITSKLESVAQEKSK